VATRTNMSSTAYPPEPAPAPRILVLGGGDVGSAVAHGLFRCGALVLIAERMRSPHARRGMAFTDALFDGEAVLEGISARHVAEVQGVEQCWRAAACIPVVTLAESLLTAAIRFDVVIDATMRRDAIRADLRAMAPCVVGLGPGYEPGINCHVAIETQWGETMGLVLRDRRAAARSGGPRPLDGITRERFVPAPVAGVWRTSATLGQSVRSGDVLGHLGEHALHAPIDGHLRGLARDGVEVMAGQRLVEVDPRQSPEIAGLGERPRAIAQGVLEALAHCLPGNGRS
jgi:xanthine dehydrogenase accessory factor